MYTVTVPAREFSPGRDEDRPGRDEDRVQLRARHCLSSATEDSLRLDGDHECYCQACPGAIPLERRDRARNEVVGRVEGGEEAVREPATRIPGGGERFNPVRPRTA